MHMSSYHNVLQDVHFPVCPNLHLPYSFDYICIYSLVYQFMIILIILFDHPLLSYLSLYMMHAFVSESTCLSSICLNCSP